MSDYQTAGCNIYDDKVRRVGVFKLLSTNAIPILLEKTKKRKEK